MNSDTPCPDDDDLRRLLLGLPGGIAAAGLEAHFAGCARCEARAAEVDPGDDELVDAARAAGLAQAVPDVPVTVMNRLRGLLPPPRATDELEPGRRIGAYRVDRVLGRGGMGVVYLARHDRLDRLVALKLLPLTASPDRLARFRRETEAIASVRHPNVVQVFEVGEADGLAFYVMEYVPGGPLSHTVAAAPLPPAEAARLLEATARGVAAGHTGGVIHRDLKPANVLLDPPNGPKVSDFGLAKYRERGSSGEYVTIDGAVLGTPNYMAPEQATGGASIDLAVDVYGLGAILYECLTGRPPFAGSSPLETLELVRTQDPVPPGRLQPNVPRDLQTICLKCLEKDPRKRYASADNVADDLGRFLRGEPVQARPVGLPTRAAKWARRRPTTAVVLVALASSIVLLVAVVAAYTVRLRGEVRRANASAEEANRHRDRAATNYRAARSALRGMLARLADRSAIEIPRLQELRKAQLEHALAFYEEVLVGLDDPDLAIQLDAALALVEVGSIRYELGSRDAARVDLQRAAGVLEQLAGEYRTQPECRSGLATCYDRLAYLTGDRTNEGEAYCWKALAEVEALAQGDSADPSRQNSLARAHHNLAVWFWVTKRYDRVEAHYHTAVDIRTGLIDRHSQVNLYRVELGEDLLNLGLLYSSTDRAVKAADAFGRAEDLLRPLVKAQPSDDRYGTSLAAVYVNWGNLLRSSGDPSGGIARFDEAVVLADAVIRREPLSSTARRTATAAHGARATALIAANRPADAISDWDRVIDFADNSDQLGYRVSRAATLAIAGRHTRAAAEAHELARVAGVPADNRYNLACVLALVLKPTLDDPPLGGLVAAAAAEGHAAAAIQILRRLWGEGYFRRPDRANLLNEDPDLASLRTRIGFRQLLADVAGGPKP